MIEQLNTVIALMNADLNGERPPAARVLAELMALNARLLDDATPMDGVLDALRALHHEGLRALLLGGVLMAISAAAE